MSVNPATLLKDVEDAMFLFSYDNSKRVDVKQVGAVIRSVGLNPSEAELKEIQNIVQSQFGGQIDANGITKIIQPRIKQLSTDAAELKDSLSVFDNNGDGMIAVSDLRMSLTHLGETLPIEILDELVREVDQNGEGQVNVDDVVKVLLSKN